MKKYFAAPSYGLRVDVAFLLVRLVVGIAFMKHGIGKIQNPMGWAGPESQIPGIFLALAAISEFFGGMALILGLLTRLASFGIACTMFVAVYTHSIVRGDPFISKGAGSYELASVFMIIAIMFILAGPGGMALDKKVFGPK